MLSAFIGGVIFNLSNILLSASTSIAGMSVAFPLGVGLALVLGVFINYFTTPQGNPYFLFIGVLLVIVAIVLNAWAYKNMGSKGKTQQTKGIVIAILAGVMMSFFFRFIAASMDVSNFESPQAGKMTPYTAMFIFALIPLLALFAQPLGQYSCWFPILIVGLTTAAHQSWSANIYSVVGDMFPNSAVATVTGFGAMAGGISSFIINMASGHLFDYADRTGMMFMGFEGKPAGYFIVFCICAVAYLVGWCLMKILVPRYKPIVP